MFRSLSVKWKDLLLCTLNSGVRFTLPMNMMWQGPVSISIFTKLRRLLSKKKNMVYLSYNLLCLLNAYATKLKEGNRAEKKIFHLLLSLPVWICPPFCRLLLPAICSRDFLEPWRYRLYQTQNIFWGVAITNHGCHIPPNLWLNGLITFAHFRSENSTYNLSSSKLENIGSIEQKMSITPLLKQNPLFLQWFPIQHFEKVNFYGNLCDSPRPASRTKYYAECSREIKALFNTVNVYC